MSNVFCVLGKAANVMKEEMAALNLASEPGSIMCHVPVNLVLMVRKKSDLSSSKSDPRVKGCDEDPAGGRQDRSRRGSEAMRRSMASVSTSTCWLSVLRNMEEKLRRRHHC